VFWHCRSAQWWEDAAAGPEGVAEPYPFPNLYGTLEIRTWPDIFQLASSVVVLLVKTSYLRG
jgi:hypothetical protein